MCRFAFLLILIIFNSTLNSQNTIGLPDIINYSKSIYKAGAQNRQIKQDKNGVLYFANNEGVLSFDGKFWKVFSLPNRSIVRSIEFGPDNRLYVGGQDEFGYFSTAANGEPQFQSLKEIIPKEHRSFTDVWKIEFYNNQLFFQTSNKIYQISGSHCTVYESSNWRFLGKSKDILLAQDQDQGILVFNNGNWRSLKGGSETKDFLITSLTSIGSDSILISTRKNGIFLLSNEQLFPLKSSFLKGIEGRYISGIIPVNNDHLAIITNLNGCYIIDKAGNLIQNFSTKEGLQNNNILDVFIDKERNIWLGLDNGIDLIAYNNAIKHIYPQQLNTNSGYASIVHNKHLYIGTADGLYRVPLNDQRDLSFVKGNFERVENTNGQVWNLSEVNNELFLSHHDGSYIIKGNKAVLVDNTTGFWNFTPLYPVLPSSKILAGTYNGINLYEFKDGKLYSNPVQAPFESARFIVIDNNHAWSSHPYKGVFKVSLENNSKPVVKQYSEQQGVQSVIGNYIFKIKNQIILTTTNGVYQYNSAKDIFEPSSYYNNLFGNKQIRYLKEDNQGNVWFVYDKNLSVVDFSTPKPQVIFFPELKNKLVSGFEQINPIDENNVVIGGEKGFYHINYRQYKKNKYPLTVQVRAIKASGKKDSLLYGGFGSEINELLKQNNETEFQVHHSWNSIQIEYASPTYAQQANIEYSYYLEGFDKRWSEFSSKTEKEYTNLPVGDYVFYIKVRNNLGNESATTGFKLSVLPPWYRTNWAFIFYIIAVFIFLYLLYLKQQKKFLLQRLRFEEKQKQMQYMHQLELEKNEKEIIKLKNDKLEAEIQHKNTELASSAMHLVQKGEILTKIKDELQKLNKIRKNTGETEDLKKIIRLLTEEEKMNEDWEHFTMHFNKVHSDFLIRLKEKHPQLNAHELKLCAYLRMNLTSKEIAQLINISVRGVEISRYRLRKKLEIPTEVNLFQFLFDLDSKNNKGIFTDLKKEDALYQ